MKALALRFSPCWPIPSSQKCHQSAQRLKIPHATLFLSLFWLVSSRTESHPPLTTQEPVIEWTIQSTKQYKDPFNDLDVDVIFTKDGLTWRVPTFWRGGQRWTVRFAPPTPGEYSYRIESSDSSNSDLNGREGKFVALPYDGKNPLLRHGMVRVSANKRNFEFQDGVPFYWLGDTWWTGLSDRLSWKGFKQLSQDRSAKGFTIVQIVAGLVPPEEDAPVDAGYRNEGGAVWDPKFLRINPKYFDYADRRIQQLLDVGLIPAIVGGWGPVLDQTGIQVLKKHWRYVIARYGAFPVLWIVGGEVVDPPPEVAETIPNSFHYLFTRGWTEITRYLRDTDPYHHPVTVHESAPPFDYPIQDESLTDFDMFQSSHFGWGSIAAEVAQMDVHYARTNIIKPIVEGEIGYERLGEIHLEDFQRTAFWLSMLNGAAGHTYGANGVWESYTATAPLQRFRHSFMTWPEGMVLPGSYQVGLGAKLLRQYRWWKFAPHPEWLARGGTTLFAPREEINGFDIGRSVLKVDGTDLESVSKARETDYPGGEWKVHKGDFRLPYAAGIPSEVRIVYIPTRLSFSPSPAPTITGLETGVPYHTFFWEPSSGARIDLGTVERPSPGAIVFNDAIGEQESNWTQLDAESGDQSSSTQPSSKGILKILNGFHETDIAASVAGSSEESAALILRYHDSDNYIAAVHSNTEGAIYILDRRNRADGRALGRIDIPKVGGRITIAAEVRGNKAVMSINDGNFAYTTPIVDVDNISSGETGVFYPKIGQAPRTDHFVLRRSPILVKDQNLDREIYDDSGKYRGTLSGPGLNFGPFKLPGWSDFGRDKHILLDAYRPEKLPTSGDWILILETDKAQIHPNDARFPAQ